MAKINRFKNIIKCFNRKRPLLLLVILLVFVTIGFLISETGLCNEPERASETFPWPTGINGWSLSEGPADYDTKTVFNYMDGAAELFLAYNMRKITVSRYEKAGYPAIVAEIYQMASPEDAYGIFAFERNDPEAGVGQGSEFGGGLLRFWKGRYFISIYGENTGADIEAAILRFGQQMAAFFKDTGSPPKILDCLPERAAQLTKNSAWFLRSHILLNQRFFVARENLLMLAGDVEAALGRYGVGKDKVYLLLVAYPAKKKTDAAFLSFTKAYMPAAGDGFMKKTENGRWTAAEQDGRFIMIVFDAPDRSFAAQLMQTVRAELPKEVK